MINFGLNDGAEYGYDHERDLLMMRYSVLKSDIDAIDKVLGKFVEVRIGTDAGDKLADVLDMWDAKRMKMDRYIGMAVGSIRLSDRVLNKKEFMKFDSENPVKDSIALFKKMDVSTTDERQGDEFNMMFFMHKFSDAVNCMGWVLFGHTVLDHVERALNGWLYEDIQNGVRDAVGNGVEDFEAELEAERETRMKRKFG